ncbi:cysteine-rich receptor-like protein kinase 8 [Tanacetum coccineum]
MANNIRNQQNSQPPPPQQPPPQPPEDDKLTGSDNYGSWKRSMMIALNAKNKMKIIAGDYEEPAINANTRALWERTNDMIISWILNTITQQISNSLSFVNLALSLWNDNATIEVYNHKLKGLWDEYDSLEAPYMCVYICECENRRVNGERDQRKRLIPFLMGLDECYANIRRQILLMNPMPTVAKAYSMIRQEEKQREGFASKILVAAALSAHFNNYRNSYNNGGRNGRNYSGNYSQEEQVQTNMTLMAFSESEVYTNTTCSKTCMKNYKTLKKQCDDLLVKLNESKFKAATYKRGLATLEDQIITYKKNEVLYSEEIGVLKRDVACKNYEINMLKSELEKVKQEKDGIDFKIEKFEKASKDLDQLLGSQITNKCKKSLGYSAVPPPHPLIYNRPNKIDQSYSSLDKFKEPEC